MPKIKSRPKSGGTEFVVDVSEFRPTFEDVQPDEGKPAGILANISGIAAKTNIVNKNKRYYPQAAFERVIGVVQEDLKRGRILGQVEHPKDNEPGGSLMEAAIKFTRLFMQDDPTDPGKPFFAYEGVVLDTTPGRHLMSLLHAGVDVGISTRAWAKMRKGTVKESTEQVTIVEEMKLRGLDAVGDPSNWYGRIATHESTDDCDNNPDEDDMEKPTLESLRANHPDIVQSIRESVVAELNADKARQAEQEKAVTEAVTATKSELQKEFDTALEAARLGVFARAGDILDGHAPSADNADELGFHKKAVDFKKKVENAATGRLVRLLAKESVEGEAVDGEAAVLEAVEAIRSEFAPVTESVTKLEAEKQELSDKVVALEATTKELSERVAATDEVAKKAQEEAAKNARAALITEATQRVEVAPFANVFRALLNGVPTDVELVESVIKQKEAEAENVWKATGSPKGDGTTGTGDRADQQDKPVKESTTRPPSLFDRLGGF